MLDACVESDGRLAVEQREQKNIHNIRRKDGRHGVVEEEGVGRLGNGVYLPRTENIQEKQVGSSAKGGANGRSVMGGRRMTRDEDFDKLLYDG